MFHRCPHCEIVLLEEEWQTGHCTSCLGPLADAVPAEPPPAATPAPPKRNPRLFGLRGAVFALLAVAALAAWHFSRPAKPDHSDELDAVAEVQTAPPADTPERKDSKSSQAQPEAIPPPTAEPTQEPPRPTTDENKPPEPATNEKPQAFDKDKAIVFALDIMTVVDLLAKKYHRELDEDQLIDWAIRGLFDAAKESFPPALEQRMRKKAPEEFFKSLDLLAEARVALGNRKELVAPRDVDVGLQAIFCRLDPHTTLLNADAMTRLSLLQNGGSVGELGLLVRRQPRTETAEVVTPYKDGPAYMAGIRAGDTITGVRLLDGPDGQPLQAPEEIAPGTLAEEQGGGASWGPLGSRVAVTVRHPGSDQLQVHTLARSRVKKEKVLGVKRRPDDSWDHVLDPDKGIYYVRLTDFHGPETARELDRLLKGFKQPKLQGLVLDLRFTGGGLIQTAFDVADLFVPNGLIVEFRSHNLQNGKGRWMSRGSGSQTSIPLACLINAETGTCTEIVAAALQDHKRARIVGERTSGKASAQNYFPTERGTLRITTSWAHRPNGKPLNRAMVPDNSLDRKSSFVPSDSTDEWGVTPDKEFVVPLAEAERTALRERFAALVRLSRRDPAGREAGPFSDRQLEKALESLRRDGIDQANPSPKPK